MNFFYPTILYALPLALLPIIIHLINLKRHKKMYFSSLWFLKSIQQQTQRSRKIHEWLLLLIRAMLIAALVLAFAGPYIDRNKTQSQSLHVILDNTFSMESSDNQGNLFDQAKAKALNIFAELKGNSNLSLHFLANNKSYWHISPENAKKITSNSKMQHGYSTLNKITQKIKQKHQTARLIVISDFQQNIVSADTLFQDTCLQVKLIKLKSQAANISIDSLWFESPLHIPNQTTNIKLLIKNHSHKDVHDLPVRIYINQQLLSTGTTEIDAKSSSIHQAEMKIHNTGILKIEAKIQDLPVTFDNQYYSGVYIGNKTRILETGKQSSKYIKALFSDSTLFDHQFIPVKFLTISDIEKAQTIILNKATNISTGIANNIFQNIKQGSNLIIVPEIKKTTKNINAILSAFNLPEFSNTVQDSSKINQINKNHFIIKNAVEEVDENIQIAQIGAYYQGKKQQSLTPLLYNDLNNVVMFHKRKSQGNIYLFAFDALQQNFATQPIFVPLLFNATTIKSKSVVPSITCNKPATIKIMTNGQPQSETPIKIKNKQHSFIPYHYQKQNAYIVSIRKNQITQPGFYELHHADSMLTNITANHQSRESAMMFHDNKLLNNQVFKNLDAKIYSMADTPESILSPVKKLWKWFVILAILLIISEMLVIYRIESKQKTIKKHI